MIHLFFALLLVITSPISGYSVTDGTQLVSTFMILRHGDRTPTESSLKYSTNIEALRTATEKYGYGQLTNLGKQRSYNLGKFIRERYNELLSPQYNRSEIYIRSTDVARTEMTILTAMAAVYPAYPGSWSDEINWTPTPYVTVPIKYDIMAIKNCPILRSSTRSLLASDDPRMAQYKPLLDVVSSRIGVNLTATPVMILAAYDAYISQKNLGISLDEVTCGLLPDIKAAADEAFDIVFGNNQLKALQAGPLLSEFFASTSNQISGSSTPRVRVYSAHDSNVYAMQAVCKVPRQGAPSYDAMFGLELLKNVKSGKYYVLPIYLPSPSQPLKYLQVKGCKTLCPYEEFQRIVAPYTLDEETWRKQCGFTEDLVIDTSGL